MGNQPAERGTAATATQPVASPATAVASPAANRLHAATIEKVFGTAKDSVVHRVVTPTSQRADAGSNGVILA